MDVAGVPLTLVGLDDPVSGHPQLEAARKNVVRDSIELWLVTRGVGTTGIPARFRCPAELPVFTLRAG